MSDHPGFLPTLALVGRSAWAGVRREFVVLMAVSALCVVTLLWVPLLPDVDDDALSVLAVFGLFVNTVLGAGLALTALLAARGGHLGFRTFLQAFWPPGRWLVNVGLGFVLAILVGIGLVAFVLPGLWVLARLGFAVLFVNEGAYGPLGALGASVALTRGRTMLLLGMMAASAIVLALGLACFGVGIVPALAIVAVGWGAVYDVLRGEKAATGTS
jgi:hypothetical protein